MKVLVSNIGSTSFKFRLFDMSAGEREIAVGGADRIGGKGGVLKLQIRRDAGILPASEGVADILSASSVSSSSAPKQRNSENADVPSARHADKMSALHSDARSEGVPPSSDDVVMIDKRKGRYLPHWTQEGSTYAVTFRLADSLPENIVQGFRVERQRILEVASREKREPTYDERVEINRLFSTRIENWLDSGQGECILKDRRAAEIVQDAMKHFDGERYDLLAWAVMPNHVHCILRPLAGHELPKILQSWKSFTAKEINKVMGRQGQLWMEEYYDHLIRDERDFIHQVNYVVGNPEKALLKDWLWVGSNYRGQDVRVTPERGQDARVTLQRDFADHGAAIVFVMEQLVAGGALASPKDLDAVAFKAVMAGDVDAVNLVDESFLSRMEYFVPIAPAHNPPYIAAMRMFRQVLGATPLVAAMETGFHRTIPDRRRLYAVPSQWAKQYGVKRYGFHGASHRYIATRTKELMGEGRGAKSENLRIISCHMGGSSSICAIRNGQSVAVSMGLSPQSGLPQSNRAGDFDPFAFSLLQRQAGLDAPAVLKELGSGGGLAALSQTSGDIRDILQAIAKGSPEAKLTLDLFVTAVRDYIGSYLVELGGAEAIVFTGGIGQHNPDVRTAICQGLAFAGIELNETKNAAAKGEEECRIDAAGSKTALWVMPTNEELIVARQTVELLKANSE